MAPKLKTRRHNGKLQIGIPVHIEGVFPPWLATADLTDLIRTLAPLAAKNEARIDVVLTSERVDIRAMVGDEIVCLECGAELEPEIDHVGAVFGDVTSPHRVLIRFCEIHPTQEEQAHG